MSSRLRDTLGLLKQLKTRYGFTIFLSAFLLFQIQPMIARYLLPTFGGSVAVWGTALVFFTGALFIGYVYVYLISEFTPRNQARVHLSLIAATLLFVLGVLASGTTFAPHAWVLDATSAPPLQILLALVVTIGLPYFLLSTTGPLLQHWYARETGEEPYHLYALSNVGSFLALGTYPFITEPLFGLAMQQILWTAGFILCAFFIGSVAFRTRKSKKHETQAASEIVATKTLFLWLGLAALPSAMLVATTTRITQVIAPIPFLWVAPLAIYLLSFILAFRGWGQGGLTPFLVVVFAALSYVYSDWSYYDFFRQALANVGLLFFASLYCHALLYKMRPGKTESAFYYVWVALGGAVGSLIMSMVAPTIFIYFTEFMIGVAALAVISIVAFPAGVYVRDQYHQHTAFIKGMAIAAVLLFFASYLDEQKTDAVYVSRNFYGGVEVYEGDTLRYLYHGTTLHGTQFVDPERTRETTTYYTPSSGVGRAILQMQASTTRPVSVGVVGLGTGTLAAYCEEGDSFVFYDIDARVADVARDYFTYLDECAGSEVRIGDGRLMLHSELVAGDSAPFDVLAVDAFSDDTVPVHLLTKEAVELYLSRVAEDGILAIHTSNRYLELSPVVMRIAVELGLSAIVVADGAEESEAGTVSQWVVLARSPQLLAGAWFVDAADAPPVIEDTPLWTDDYANVLATVDSSPFSLWARDEE